MNSLDIEILVAKRWNPRQYCIVPNVSWGLQLHECDMLILSKSGYATEIEIKVSAADLKKDAVKGHGHNSKKIKYLYFAIPEKLLKYTDFIPERAGILVAKTEDHGTWKQTYLTEHRPAIANTQARPFTDAEVKDLCRLGTMRIWSLKQKIQILRSNIAELRKERINQSKT